jgi:hypothetical protein
LEEDEPAAMLVSLHHAREIVTPLIALHAIDQLVDGYGVDPDIDADPRHAGGVDRADLES